MKSRRLSLSTSLSLGLILGLVLVSQPPLAGAQAGDTANATRARAVVMKHMEAIGGLEAYSAIQSMHSVLEMHFPKGELDLRVETWATKPNLLYMKSRSTAGTAQGGFDGKVGWMQFEGESFQVLPRPPKNAWAPYDPFATLTLNDVKYLGVRTRGGRKMEALQMVGSDGQLTTQYFDQETGLLTRVDMGNPDAPATTLGFEQYKRFGTLLYATRLTTRIPDYGEASARVVSVDHDPIDLRVYELPKGVQEIVAKKP